MALIGRGGGSRKNRRAVLALFAVLFLAALALLLLSPSGFALMATVFLGGQLGLLAWLAHEEDRQAARVRAAMEELKRQERS